MNLSANHQATQKFHSCGKLTALQGKVKPPKADYVKPSPDQALYGMGDGGRHRKLFSPVQSIHFWVIRFFTVFTVTMSGCLSICQKLSAGFPQKLAIWWNLLFLVCLQPQNASHLNSCRRGPQWWKVLWLASLLEWNQQHGVSVLVSAAEIIFDFLVDVVASWWGDVMGTVLVRCFGDHAMPWGVGCASRACPRVSLSLSRCSTCCGDPRLPWWTRRDRHFAILNVEARVPPKIICKHLIRWTNGEVATTQRVTSKMINASRLQAMWSWDFFSYKTFHDP